MSEARAKAERDVLPKVGASFSRGADGTLLFKFVADTATVVGPRPASDADKARFPGEFAAFIASEAAISPEPPTQDDDFEIPAADEAAEIAATPRARRRSAS